MFSDGLIVTLVAVFNVSEADGRYVTLLSGWCASVGMVLEELAGRCLLANRVPRRVAYRVSCQWCYEMVWGTGVVRAIAVCGLLLEEVRKCGMRNGETADEAGGVTKEERASEDHIHLQRTSFRVTSSLSTPELQSSLAPPYHSYGTQ